MSIPEFHGRGQLRSQPRLRMTFASAKRGWVYLLQMRKRPLLFAVLFLVAGCQALATSPPAFPPVLNIDGRGNPPIIVNLGGVEVARFACGVGATLEPGDRGIPPLPWSLSVVRQSDGASLLSTTVSELPKWLTIFGDEAGLSSIAVAGPPGPTCPGSP